MNRMKRFILKSLIALMLSFTMISVSEAAISTTVEAAITVPSVKETKKTLYVGYNTYQIEINQLLKNSKATYKSSNTKVAAVNKSGIITPVVKGTAIITATLKQNNKTYSLKVTIKVENPSISLTASTDYMNVSENFIFKAKTYGLKDKIVWSVSDKTIATINSGGKLTALAAGNVSVYAVAGGVTQKCEVLIGINRIGTFSTNITCYDKTTIYIQLTEAMEGEGLDGKNENLNVMDFEWGDRTEDDKFPLTIIPKGIGTDTITIQSSLTNDTLIINVTVVKEPSDLTELNPKEIYPKCSSATVEILATVPMDGEYIGSGFFIGDGMLVTNYHVVEGAEKIQVTTKDNKKYMVQNIIAFDKDLDLAILGIDSDNDNLIISQAGATVGETIYTLGSPFGLTGTLSAGMVSTASRIIEDVNYIQINASISPGNSGGPLINAYGEVIGINTMYYENGQNLNFAINIQELQKLSTNWPITITDYYAIYSKQKKEEYLAKTILEDPDKSDNPDICQEIPPLTSVLGTLEQEEDGDYYYFKLHDAGQFIGVIDSENLADLKNTWFVLYYYEGDMIVECTENLDDLYQYIEIDDLPSGEYIIFIYHQDDYVGEELPYVFMLNY